MGADGENLPGMQLLDGLYQAQSRAMRRYMDTLNEVWSDLMTDAQPTSMWQGYNKVMQTHIENAKLLWQSCTAAHGSCDAPNDCPNVVFVMDSVAEASDPREVPLPFQVGPDDPIAYQWLKLGAGAVPPDGVLDVSRDAGRRCIFIALKDLQRPDLAKSSTYVAVVYRNKLPLPYIPLAVVVMHFA